MVFGLLDRDDLADDLDEVREAETVADVLDRDLLERLPAGWSAQPEVVQFGDRPLSEVLVVSTGRRDREFVLAPTDTYEPTGETEVLVRAAGRRHSLELVGSLSAAVGAVAARVEPVGTPADPERVEELPSPELPR